MKMKLWKKIYKYIPDGKVYLIARIYKDVCGRYMFETNTNKGNFKINMNMPEFATEQEAENWINSREDWKAI